MQETYFFGYGSLMFPEGTNGRGMKYLYMDSDFHVVKLMGFERGAYLDWASRRYYSIKPNQDKHVMGTLVGIADEEDLNALLINELALPKTLTKSAYDIADVTKLIEGFTVPSEVRVLTLVHPDKTEATDGELYAWYQQFVWRHIQRYGKNFVKDFLATGGRGMAD